MENVHKHIEHSISRRKKGDLIFPTDFRAKGTQTAVKTALSRLSREGKLKRLAHGIYYVPKIDPLFGAVYPAPEEVARCAPHLLRQVALIKPRLILSMGRFASQALLGTEASIAALRGRLHSFAGTPVVVTYHPAYLLRTPTDKARAWEDLLFARTTWLGLQNVAPTAT